MLTLPEVELVRARSLDEALAALSEPAARILAGGTDLVPRMKRGLVAPRRLVSVRRVPEVAGIAMEDDGALTVGASVTLAQIAADTRVRDGWPAFARACELVASPAIRNVATLGGNVCLEPRCAYYDQTEFWRAALGHCTRSGGEVCWVVEGGRRCVAGFAADAPIALVAYGADVRIAGPTGKRSVSLRQLYGADGARHLRLAAGEMVTGVRVPKPPPGTQASYVKVRPRASIDFPALSLGVLADAENVVVVSARWGPSPASSRRPVSMASRRSRTACSRARIHFARRTWTPSGGVPFSACTCSVLSKLCSRPARSRRGTGRELSSSALRGPGCSRLRPPWDDTRGGRW